jgi:penicillin-binding protein 1A
VFFLPRQPDSLNFLSLGLHIYPERPPASEDEGGTAPDWALEESAREAEADSRAEAAVSSDDGLPRLQEWPVPQAVSIRVPAQTVRRATLWGLAGLAVMLGVLSGMLMVYSAELPQIEDLERYHPIAITQVYDVHGRPVGSFALQRRVVASYDDFPWVLRQAVISIEDKNFESHWGVNMVRIFGAIYHDLSSNSRTQGASTLTMQLSRNLFLTPERTFSRKMREVLLSVQMEHHFTKPQIFTLYANQIYLGHGLYGFEAASEYYFSKPAKDLTLPEAATLAGIPKSPTNYSPVLNPEKSLVRRNLVLTAMERDGAITPDQADEARRAPLGLHLQGPANTNAPWFVEAVRQELEKKYGEEDLYEGGLRVYTTLDNDLEAAATRAVLTGMAQYERRHGWHGHLSNVIAAHADLNTFEHPDWSIPPHADEYVHAMVTFVLPTQVSLKIGQRAATLDPAGWSWTGYPTADRFLHQGDIVYVHIPAAPQASHIWTVNLEQDSGAQASLLAMDNSTGDVLAMVGGRDFLVSQFNRATQATRQAGSSFKPYVYAAAVEDGARPTDRIEDSPTSFDTGSGPYIPQNYDHRYLGNMSLLAAFADSRNIPALRLADSIGIGKVVDVARRCGITTPLPYYLPIALGAADVTLEEQVEGFSVFPNDGVRVTPRLIRRVTTPEGRVLEADAPLVSGAVSDYTARTMVTFLQQVIRGGTGVAANALHHPLGGKTGTTDEFTDAWFLGFSPSVTAGVWVGYDNNLTLGEGESGSRTALPIWIDFMRTTIASHPGERFPAAISPAHTTRATRRLTAVVQSVPTVVATAGINPAPLPAAANGATPATIAPAPAIGAAPAKLPSLKLDQPEANSATGPAQ